MNFETLEPALVDWIKTQTGIPVAQFKNKPRLQSRGLAAYLSWVSNVGVGIEETRYEDSGAAAPESNLVPIMVGNRKAVLQITVESFNQSSATVAQAYCEKLRSRVRSPSSLRSIKAMGLALIGVGASFDRDYAVDDRMISSSILEVSFNATSFERDEAGVIGSIESVDVTDIDLTNVDGTPLPADLQWDHHVIPES